MNTHLLSSYYHTESYSHHFARSLYLSVFSIICILTTIDALAYSLPPIIQCNKLQKVSVTHLKPKLTAQSRSKIALAPASAIILPPFTPGHITSQTALEMTTVNENFDIFVINLARRQDRWHQISTDLSTMGLRHKQKIALDGKHVFQSDNDMVRQGLVTQEALDADHALSRGAVALTLTSREVWEECKQSDKPYCVILEDDMLVGTSLRKKLYDIRSHIDNHKTFDVLLLHQNVWGGRNSDTEKNPYNAEWVERDNPAPIVPAIFGFSTAAYLINGANAADKLLAASTLPIDAPLDLFWWGTAEGHKKPIPEEMTPLLTHNSHANDLVIKQTHPLWFKGLCATSSNCYNGVPNVKDSEIFEDYDN